MGASGEAGGHQAGLTRTLARFLAQSRWEDIPAATREEGKRGILNAAGCILAGRKEPEIALLRRVFPHDAALIDAAAATARDYDDTHLPTVIHTGPPVAGALFALARKRTISGSELMHAFILGVETSCRIGNAVTPGHYERGWHITSTCGVFGAAVAAGKILRLNEEQFICALGVAATQSAGLVEVLGSMARVLNAGFAARNGMQAAALAAEGFQGPERPIEGLRGFINVFGGSQDFSAITNGLGVRWELTEVAYKPYPAGVVLHALIDACLKMKDRNPERIVVTLHPLAIERTDRPEPRNAIEARLSAQHAVAVALVRGRAGLEEFSDAAALDPALKAFRGRVTLVADERLDKMATIVSDGKTTVRRDAAEQLDAARLEAKFRELAGSRADEWLRLVHSLESLDKVTLPE